MPSSTDTVAFASPLRHAALSVGEISRAIRHEELEAARQAAYRQGFSDATEAVHQQVGIQRREAIRLMEQALKSLDEQREEMWQKIAALLPDLAVEIARRVLRGLEPDPARVAATVDEVLAELAPGTRDIEVILPPADLELLSPDDSQYRERFPGLRFTADESLSAGDCRLRSPFGLVDATVATKLQTLTRSLR